MKLSKLEELHDLLDKRAVLQHFVDSPSESLFIGMKGVTNQIVLQRELDLKVRVLLGIQVEKMEEEMKAAGIDMTPEKKKPEPDKKKPESEKEKKKPEPESETPPEKIIDATASEPGEGSKESTTSEEGSGADEEDSTE